VSDVDDTAWALMVQEIGDAVHEFPDMAEALLPRYRQRIEKADAE
jgi:hypothetical protein